MVHISCGYMASARFPTAANFIFKKTSTQNILARDLHLYFVCLLNRASTQMEAI